MASQFIKLPKVGGAGAAQWGLITGTLSNQSDLQSALNAKQNALGFTPEDVANKSISTSLGTSDTLYPSQKAVKVYTDTALANKRSFNRIVFGDANYVASSSDRVIASSVVLTAPRTVTLPLASSVPNGEEIFVTDFAGAINGANTITIARAGSDTINGSTQETIGAAYGMRKFISDGVGAWSFDAGVERVINKATSLSSPDNIRYPTTLAVSNALSGKQDTLTNPVTGTGVSGQVSFWGGTTTQVGSSNLFWDNTNSRLGLGTTAPTHTVTHGSSSTGQTFYGTADQVTNFERLRTFFGSSRFNISTESGGTGSNRDLLISGGGSDFNIGPAASGTFAFQARRTTTALPGLFNVTSAGLTSSTVFQSAVSLTPTYNQTGSAGGRALWISPLITAVGSSGNFVIDAGNNTSADGAGTHTPVFRVQGTGLVQVAGAITHITNNITLAMRPSGSFTTSGSGLRFSSVTFSASSGTNNAIEIDPTYNQTGTASSNDILINRTSTALGSGSHTFINCQVSSNSRFQIDTEGRIAIGAAPLPSASHLVILPRQSSWNCMTFTATASYTGNFLRIQDNASVELLTISSNGRFNFPTAQTATTATAGAQSLPAQPAGFILCTVNGTTAKIPYYNN